MTKICDLKAIFAIFVVLFIATVSTQNLSPALCGGLHSGVDRCKEYSDNQTVFVRGQPLPKPFIIDSTTNQIHQINSRRNNERKRGFKLFQNRLRVPTKRNRPLLRNPVVNEMEPIGFQRTVGPVGFEKTVEPVGFERTVGPVGFERTVGPVGFERTVRPVGFERTVGPVGFERTVGPVGFERTVGPVGFERTVRPVGFERTVGPVGFERTVRPVGFERTVGPVGFERTVGPVGFEKTVGPVGFERTVGPVEFERTVGPVGFEKTVGPVGFERTVEPVGFERTVQYAPQIQRVQVKVPSMDPNVKLAPRFHPIGDLCYKKGSKPEPGHRLAETMIITPANQPKIECYTESSSGMPLGSTRFNTMLRGQTFSGDTTSQIPQLLSGSLATNFGRQRTKPHNKPRGGSISIDTPMNTNSADGDVRMRGLVVNLNEQNSNLVRTNGFRSNLMNSGFMVNNPMNRGLNVYSGNSAVVGVAPQINGVQRTSYVPRPRPFLFGGTAAPLSRNSNTGFIVTERNKENRVVGDESSQPPSMDSPADLVSVAVQYKHLMESYKQAAENVGGNNPISNAKIPEGKISYGPETIPINGQVEEMSKEIPEEKLHVSEKPVIELNLQKPSDTLRSFDGPTKPVTYNELGFVEKTYDTPRFPEKSVVYESPVNNPELRIDGDGSYDSEYYLRYPVASKTIVGELVRSEPVPLEYGPSNPNFPFSLVDKPAYQPAQSWSQNINEQPKLRYSVTNKNVGQLIANTPMLPQSRSQEICYCNKK